MAKKASKSIKSPRNQSSSDPSVVRIRAIAQPTRKSKEEGTKETPIAVKATKVQAPQKTKSEKASRVRKIGKPVKSAGGYFKGAWVELRQVRWPNRRATWSLTFAVLVYSAFFVVLVLLLDAGFKYLFELILGK